MSDLMPWSPRTIGTDTVNTVNARDLYDYLELSIEYTRWIRVSLRRADLVENIDYTIIHTDVGNSL
jgi:phage anti-repressor protein